MDIRNAVLYTLVFLLGALSVSFVYEFKSMTQPTETAPAQSLAETVTALATGKDPDRLSPADHIKESQIKVYDDRIQLDIKNAIWSRFTDTKSMDPFFDSTANGLEIVPNNATQIKVGDIISYQSGFENAIIIHRVIKIDSDDNGTYFIVKGDNNPVQDPERVRFSQVKGILVGIIY